MSPNVCPASTSFTSTPRIAAYVLMYTGNTQPSAMRNTFGNSPTPNQMITSGTRPRIGTARAAWMTGSIRSSPTQNSPHSTASATPAATPTTRPSATRCSEMSMFDWSTSWDHSSRAASSTAIGEATSTLVKTPSVQASCHAISTRTGPITRRASRGIRIRPSRCSFAADGRTSVILRGGRVSRRRCGCRRETALGGFAENRHEVPAEAPADANTGLDTKRVPSIRSDSRPSGPTGTSPISVTRCRTRSTSR